MQASKRTIEQLIINRYTELKDSWENEDKPYLESQQTGFGAFFGRSFLPKDEMKMYVAKYKILLLWNRLELGGSETLEYWEGAPLQEFVSKIDDVLNLILKDPKLKEEIEAAPYRKYQRVLGKTRVQTPPPSPFLPRTPPRVAALRKAPPPPPPVARRTLQPELRRLPELEELPPLPKYIPSPETRGLTPVRMPSLPRVPSPRFPTPMRVPTPPRELLPPARLPTPPRKPSTRRPKKMRRADSEEKIRTGQVTCTKGKDGSTYYFIGGVRVGAQEAKARGAPITCKSSRR